jgi:uncharacterized tellurite resistance protein B-like protein
MGLFDALLGGGSSSETLTPQEAYAGILVAVACGDGHLSEQEIGNLANVLPRMKLYQSCSGDQQIAIVNRMIGLAKKHGLQVLMERSTKACPPALRQTAFANAVDIVLADGIAEESEREVLQTLMRLLNIPGDDAKTIVDVMVIKNRG